jgi:pteridine reductase
MELSGSVAIVTGGAVRLGRAMALGLARAGARVMVHYGHSADAAHHTVAAIEALGGEAVAVWADLLDAGVASTIVGRGVERFGRVDVLVNSASIYEPVGVADTTESLWEQHFAINLKAPFFLCQAFAAQLGERRGHIVNIADWRGARPTASGVAYTLTKAGLIAMTQILAQALAPNVQVNAIAPGVILPPPGEGEEYVQRLLPSIPLRRSGSPADIVEALLYLLRSDYVTGEVLHVTGGQHL